MVEMLLAWSSPGCIACQSIDPGSLQVNGKPLFPGAGMLECAFAAAGCLMPDARGDRFALTDVALLAPIMLSKEV